MVVIRIAHSWYKSTHRVNHVSAAIRHCWWVNTKNKLIRLNIPYIYSDSTAECKGNKWSIPAGCRIDDRSLLLSSVRVNELGLKLSRLGVFLVHTTQCFRALCSFIQCLWSSGNYLLVQATLLVSTTYSPRWYISALEWLLYKSKVSTNRGKLI